MDIATVLTSLNAKVRSMSAHEVSGVGIVSVSLEVKNASELKYIMSRLSSIPGISSVTRNRQ